MKMQKKQFRIGTLAKTLNLEKFVIRFWEKEFNIKSARSTGKQRYYTTHDIERFKTIKQLLYEKKFTIAGAKDILQGQINKQIPPHQNSKHHARHIALQDLLYIRSSLAKLQKLL